MIRVLLLLLLAAPITYAQVRFDAGVGLVFPTASANFQTVPGLPSCCPLFEGGSGTGFSFGLGADVPIVGNLIVSLRAGTSDQSHTLTTLESISVAVDGNSATADVIHSMALTQQVYTADLLLGYRLGPVTLRAGMGYMFRDAGSLEAKEQIDGPAGATFIDTQSDVRNQGSIPLPERVPTTLQWGMSIAMNFPLDAQRRWQLAPEVGITFPLESVTSMVSWKVTVPSATVRLSWNPFVSDAPPEPVPAKENEVINAAEVAPVGAEPTLALDVLGNPTVTIEEIEQETYLPVLPYVFFDNDRATVPSRYVQSLRESLPTVAEQPDRFHQRILPLLAKRLREFPKAKITVVGATSARERDASLARNRARAIADMLRDSLGVDARRISVVERSLPENPTKAVGEEMAMADEENSRVEIQSDDYRVLLPYYVQDTLVQMTPPQLQIMARTPAPGGLTGWTLSVNDTELRSSGQAFSRPVTYAPTQAMVRSLLASGEIRIKVDGDIDQQTTERETTIPVTAKRLFTKRTEMMNDSIVEEFALVIFDYNSAVLTPMHLNVLEMVRNKIGSKARVYVEGRTDIMGSVEANLELSQQRAQAVAEHLGGGATHTGRGEPPTSVPQVLPEQRMLERIVRIRALVPTAP